METQLLVPLILAVVYISYKLLHSKYYQKNLPPSPPCLPIIGHFHLLKNPFHIFISNLLEKYGPILYLRLGTRPVVVLSSPAAIKECFTKNDIIFANRPHLLMGKHLNYNFTTLIFVQYGDLWRNLRRLTTQEYLSSTRLQMSSNIRKEEVSVVVRQMFIGCKGNFKKVELQSIFRKLTFNMIMRIIGTQPFFQEDEMVDQAKAKEKLMDLKSTFCVTGKFGLGDFFPFLKWVDIWRVEKVMMKLFKKRDKFLHGLINDCRTRRTNSSFSASTTREDRKEEKDNNTIIDVLLSLQESQPAYYTDNLIKGVIQVMLIAGSEATFTTAEWAMSLLLNHPEVLNTARTEIECNVGYDRLLNETDLDKLPYLHNIIRETLRLYNLGPFGAPHESSDDCTIGGYYIPKGTLLFVNFLALHRDPKAWSEPTIFKPERFEKDRKGNEGLQWMPFGVGRRGCPGEGFAKRMLGLMLGILIQCFDWEQLGGEMVDMTTIMERGFILKAKPLEAMYRPSKSMFNVLSRL